jgi:hypothetical protein
MKCTHSAPVSLSTPSVPPSSSPMAPETRSVLPSPSISPAEMTARPIWSLPSMPPGKSAVSSQILRCRSTLPVWAAGRLASAIQAQAPSTKFFWFFT